MWVAVGGWGWVDGWVGMCVKVGINTNSVELSLVGTELSNFSIVGVFKAPLREYQFNID